MVGIDEEEPKIFSAVVGSLLRRFVALKLKYKIYAFPSDLPAVNCNLSCSVSNP